MTTPAPDEIDKILVLFSKKLAIALGERNAGLKLSLAQKHAEDAQAEAKAAIQAEMQRQVAQAEKRGYKEGYVVAEDSHAIITAKMILEARIDELENVLPYLNDWAITEYYKDRIKELTDSNEEGGNYET